MEHRTFQSEREVAHGIGAEGVVAGTGQHGGLVEVGHPPRPRRGYQKVDGELAHVANRQRWLRPRDRKTKRIRQASVEATKNSIPAIIRGISQR